MYHCKIVLFDYDEHDEETKKKRCVKTDVRIFYVILY